MTDYIRVNLQHESIFDYVQINYKTKDGFLGKRVKVSGYTVLEDIGYFSKRYDKWVVVEAGDKSDGATSALDIDSFGWIFHDDLCANGMFEDGSECNNWQASSILSDILKEEGRWFRCRSWRVATWLFGGGKARDNGMR